MVKPAARLGDVDSFSKLGCCVYLPNVVTPSSSNTFINGRMASRVGDTLTSVYGNWVCSGGGFCRLSRRISGNSKVIINGRPAARLGDSTNLPSNRRILTSSNNVFFG